MSSFAVSATEFDVVWRAQGHGRPPVVLDMPSPGATHTERARIEHDAWAALTERGLANGHGEPGRAMVHALGLIARPLAALELYTEELNALLVRGNRSAALVEFAGDRLLVHTVPDTGLAYTLVSLVPELPAGVGESITVDVTLLAETEAAATPIERRGILQRGGLPRNRARTLVEMITGATGHGQIAGEVTTRGVVRRAEHIVVYFHNHTGRYQVIRRITATGDHVTITPTTTAQLAAAVTELISEQT